jgi:hypothetical protein
VPIELIGYPKAVERPARATPMFTDSPTPDKLYLRMLEPARPDGFWMPCVMNNGMLTGATRHEYFMQDARNINYPGPSIEGPYGIGRGGFSLGVEAGHNGGAYSWDCGGNARSHRTPDGARTVLWGAVDAYPIYYADVKSSPLRTQRGRWNPDAPGPHQPVNAWKGFHDPRTTRQGRPGNPVIDGLVTHDGDVYEYTTDRGDDVTKGRLLLAIYEGNDPGRGKLEQYDLTLPGGQVVKAWRSLAKEPRIEVLLTGLDPDSLCGGCYDSRRNLIYLPQRGLDSVIAVQPPTVAPRGESFVNDCKVVGTLIQSSQPPGTYGTLRDRDSKLKWNQNGLFEFLPNAAHTLTQRQDEVVVAPEWCQYVPGADGEDDYLTYSSRAQRGVKRLNLVTKAIDQPVKIPTSPDNGKMVFVVHAVSRGAAWPKWTIATQAFDGMVSPFARPRLFVPQPDGTWKSIYWQKLANSIISGNGAMGWQAGTYGTSVDFGAPEFGVGALYYGDTQQGLCQITLSQPGDKVPTAADMNIIDAGMAITTFDGIIGAAGQDQTWVKTGARTTVANAWFTLFDIAGNPGAGTLAGVSTAAGVIPVATDAGFPAINAFGLGNNGYLSNVDFGSTVPGRIKMYDMLYKAGAYPFNAAQTLAAQPALTRVPGTIYTGLQLWVECVTAFTGIPTITITYTNEAGTAGRTTGAVTWVAATVGRMLQLPLQAGDKGLQKIESVTSITATVGTFNVLIMRRLWSARVRAANDGDTHGPDKTGMPDVYEASALYPIIATDSTLSGVPELQLSVING